jgi:predicted enzyme related to lactoylglutathione lyase
MSRVIWFEMHVDNPDRATFFYRSVFGWNFSPFPGSEEYWIIKTGDPATPGIDGGMMRRRDPEGATYNTIAVPSVDDTIAKVTSHGGQIVVPKMPIPTVGWLAYFKDTEGNIFGVMQMDPSAK